ncbi:metallo-beta-lactamase superfamily domain-containing protein [Hirsutella rhossiliensis]|uniref:Cleavage and polyadenylation specificity factor subunit 2 n=1 Tax=Hirsutella rhossiliensis TaxID=111463 RepID=A0A9P8MZ09_9HYPO|nr:metallo-beta-lactamase superfamily domain-containing protein [Hirsutella rhossiliensis]KAH0964633.1 metallo-beta-lactamase superfamily domain-containing protein [Hirsutella rhossiliensis]
MFTFCPLQGALSESTASQSLLELDGGVKVLVDLGWDESFDVNKLAELEKQVPTLSLILLTHATVSHLAAYVHCCKNFPLFTRVPAYATRPVIDLGRSLTQDLYSSTPAACTTISQSSLSELAYAYSQTASTAQNLLLQSPTPSDIARYFSLIQPLKYSQPHQPLPSPFSPPLNGLTITAYNAGHTLGGTIWHIQHGLESIVYAVDWNQARENVFAGAAWLDGAAGGGAEVIEQLRKPTALICSSRGAQAGGRVKRDESLIDMIKACVSKGGTVLIPVDSSARVLEMAYFLEHAWRQDASPKGSTLRSAKLYLAGRNMSSTMRYARSMLEWMDNNIVQEFEAKEAGPFDFKHLRLLERRAQIAKLLSRVGDHGESKGRVILASDMSMEWGFSKDLIKGLASDSKNLVILTDRPSVAKDGSESVARTLWEWWKEKRDGVSVEQTAGGDQLETVYGGGRELQLRQAARQALEGDELAVYQQWLVTQRQLQATQHAGGATALEASADVDDASSDSSSDSEDEDGQQQGKALTVSATMGQAGRKNVVLKDEDLGINVLIKKKGVYDFDSRGKRGRERCFPLAVRRKRNDDFGELIRPEDYLRAEEKDEDNADGGNVAAEDDKLGKKRKWGDVAKRASGPRRRGQGGKAQAAAEAVDGAAAAAASAAEAVEHDELDAVEDTEPEEPTGPSKLVYNSETIAANLRIAFVDFSGLHDRRSLDMLIPLIQPRKLILVGGSRDETMALAADCRAALAKDGDKAVDVFTPEVGVWVDASVDTNAWVVKLADPLVKKIKWQNVRGFSIVTISGQLHAAAGASEAPPADEDESRAKRQKTEPSSAALAPTSLASSAAPSALPVLDVVPVNLLSATRTAAQPLHVGDLRLADLRRAMQGAGHGAEFRGEGMLVVDGSVVVRKTTEGRVEVESVGLPVAGGARRNTVYAVKRAIYEGLAVVAGA